MVNNAMRVFTIEALVSGPLIGAKQADFMGDGFADERGESIGSDVRNYPRDHISLATNGTHDWRFARTYAACSSPSATFIPMPVFGQAADESFIDFDDSAELINILHESHADLVAHKPSGVIRTEAHVAIDLQSAHAFLARKHEMDHAEPLPQRLVRVLENRSGDVGKAVAVWCALFALPMPFARRKIVNSGVTATRAANALGPAARDQVSLASVFVWKRFLELGDGQLMNWLWLFAVRHDGFSITRRRYHG
jgi:hypothetical protein